MPGIYERELPMPSLRVTLPLLALALMVVAVAQAQMKHPAAGKWTSEFDSQIGHQKYLYEFSVDGETLTGKAHRDVEGDVRDTPLTEGKVKGAEISFVEVLKLDDLELRIEYKGKINGDEIKLTRAVGDLATNEIVAKRVKESTTKPATQPSGGAK
jgi:hypothetical protein